MADNYRDQSRTNWHRGDGGAPTIEQLSFGALQRIADATELMAKRYQELIDQKDRAETSRDYWRNAHDREHRRVIALRGQITKLKNALAKGATND